MNIVNFMNFLRGLPSVCLINSYLLRSLGKLSNNRGLSVLGQFACLPGQAPGEVHNVHKFMAPGSTGAEARVVGMRMKG
jgi:hypothetical protein